MQYKDVTRSAAVAATILSAGAAVAADKPAVDKAAVDKAFDALKTYDWGADYGQVRPIADAVTATFGDAAARKELEGRLLAALKSGISRSAKDVVCRALMVAGTAESVPTLAALLPEAEMSHMARYALERIQAPEAAAALRDALPKLNGKLKIGAIGSLGVRRDATSVPALAGLLGDADAAVAKAAAAALGDIGTPEAAKTLGDAKPAEAVQAAVADASLACAERLLADGKKVEAMAVYKSLSGEQQPKHVRLAATRGLLSAAGKKD